MHNTALKSLQEGHLDLQAAHTPVSIVSHVPSSGSSQQVAGAVPLSGLLSGRGPDRTSLLQTAAFISSIALQEKHCSNIHRPEPATEGRPSEPSRTGGRAAQLLQTATFSAAAAQHSHIQRGAGMLGRNPPAC